MGRTLGVLLGAAVAALIGASSAGAAEQASRVEVAPGVFMMPVPGSAGGGRAAASAGEEAEPQGRSAQTRIVGGQQTTIANWPWQAAITGDSALFAGNAFNRAICGGTLIAPTVVVSAAHCFFDVIPIAGDDADNDFDDPDKFAVVTGRTQLSSSAGQEIEVIAGYSFEDQLGNQLYNPVTREWDLFVVELASSSSAQTIKVAGPGERALWAAGRTAHATGWGSTASGGPPVDLLREVEIGIIPDSTCGSPSSYGGTFSSETMVCAGVILGGKDSCQGDSGGPLVVPTAAGGHRLVGDTSFGAGCARPFLPGVYGRLADDPMRTALANTVLSVAGVNVLGSGAVPPDLDAPETTITSGPSGPTKKRSPKFGFNSSEAGSSFDCRLDSGAWSACTSPKSHSKLPEGRHAFKVRATDVVGNTDPTPAKRSFKVDTKLRGSAKAKSKQSQKGSRITVKVKVSAKEKLNARAGGSVELGKASYQLEAKSKQLEKGRSEKLKLKPKKSKGRKRLAEALGNGKTAKASLNVKLTDEAGNKATKKLGVRLRGR